MSSPRIPNVALFLIAAGIWGSTWLAITWQLGTVPPEVSVAYRFGLAAAMLAAWCRLTGQPLRLPRREHRYLALFGATLFGLNYVAVYWAERYVASGLVAVVFATIVFMSPVGMRLAYGTPLRARTFVAAALGVGGVAMLFVPELDAARRGGSALLGIVYALVATAIATGGNLLAVRNHNAGLPTLPATAWGMLYGALTAALLALVMDVPWTFEPTFRYVASLVYLSLLGSVIAFAAYLTLLQRVGAAPTAFVGVATPVIALLLSTLFEGYRWTPVAVAGVLLAVAGNWLALRK
ncbi:MAG: EamA family transporter [Burkholderiales bacterium]